MSLNRALSASILSALFPLLTLAQPAQTTHRSNEVTGMSGVISLLPNAGAGQTTIAFTSGTPLTPTSNQIVFVLQEQNSSLPPAWSGKAKVFTGDGFVAVVPEESFGRGWIFEFPDRTAPPSLSKLNLQVSNVFGIARYGETVPLTKDQIENLASTGSCGSPAPANKSKASPASESDGAGSAIIPLMAKCDSDSNFCTSGGDGASQCSAGGGGCSVTCTSGFNACCDANKNQCHCCKTQD